MDFFKLNLNLNVQQQWLIGLITMLMVSFCAGTTDPNDVYAINSLYAALGSPTLPGWIPLGGDPCTEAWQGVLCVNSNITEISLNNANLQGQLGTTLNAFSSIITINLSGNRIGGTIPANLPPTIRTLILSDNQLTGSIPDLSASSQLTDLSLNKNNLTGVIPDSFQQLQGLINLDLSENNISGPLPPSMGNLSTLTTLHLQDNQLTGLLDVLQNLPLSDLNIENNQFSGPIPPRLLTIPNFRSTGNPFNTSVIPSPPIANSTMGPPTNSSFPRQAPPTETPKQEEEDNPSSPDNSNSSKSTKFLKTIISAAVVVVVLVALVLGIWFCIARRCKKRQEGDEIGKGNLKPLYEGKGEKPRYNDVLPTTHNQVGKAFQETSLKKPYISNLDEKPAKDVKEVTPISISKDAHSIDMEVNTFSSMSTQPVPPPRHFSNENITLKPIMPTLVTKKSSFPSSVKSFTIASLQEYTNSFSQENLIGEGMVGSVYRAELPDGKLVAVKKLNNPISREQSEEEFAELISFISNIKHENIVNLVGYCNEHGQKLIIYEFCNTSLYDALHPDGDNHKKLSWNTRIKIALGVAKGLEHLHEACHPAVVHKNFKSANILLDDSFEPLISDCGLVALLSDTYTAQVSGGYGAPELELGTYTKQSDVFSFGVVMLELLTGRKSHDSTRPRGEQFLVRWAIPQLHDIDALSKMVDPSLDGSYPSKSLSRFADIISLCVQAEPEFRPPMSEILQDLLKMIQRES